jgi:hypothetical protein
MLEEREVLHVPRANLNDVSPFGDQVEGFVIDGFGDDAQAKLIADLGHDLQGFDAQALERVRRGTRLVGAAAEELRAGGRDLFGNGECLLARFNGARTGDDGEVAAADLRVGSFKADDGVFFFDVAAGQLVGLADADDFGDAGELFDVAAVDFTLVAGDADGGALGSWHGMRAIAQLLDVVADGLDLFRRGLRLHDD